MAEGRLEPPQLMPGRKASARLISTGVLDENGDEIGIYYDEVWSYVNEDFLESWRFYLASKRMTESFGAPVYSGGWTTWPTKDVKVLLILSEEEERFTKQKERERLEEING